MLRSIAALAAVVGLAAVLGGCGGGGGGKGASCSLHSRRLKMYLVFYGNPVSRSYCASLGRSLSHGPVAFRTVKGQSNYAADKRVCVVHGSGGEMDAYADVHAPHLEHVQRLVCKYITHAARFHLPGG